jgi:hypothetical protein
VGMAAKARAGGLVVRELQYDGTAGDFRKKTAAVEKEMVARGLELVGAPCLYGPSGVRLTFREPLKAKVAATPKRRRK